MRTNDERIAGRILRRLKSSTGAVMLEFAFVAPLVISVVVFAADFCRLLVAQQHLEIAARCMADIESHYYQTNQTAVVTSTETPHRTTKQLVANYLCEEMGELGKSDDGKYYTSSLCQVEVRDVPGPLSVLRKYTFDKLTTSESDGWGFKILKFIIKGILNIITGGTHEYFNQLLSCDRMVGATCAIRLKTLFPVKAYKMFTPLSDDGGYVYVVMTHYKNELNGETVDYTKREKHFCYMPVMDTAAVPPGTWIRKAERHLKKSAFMNFLRKIGITPDDMFKKIKNE